MDYSSLVNLITEMVQQELLKNKPPVRPAEDEDEGRLIPVAISNRHVHLSEKDIHTLFGPNYQMHRAKDLSQPGQYACEETVTLVGPKGVIEKVRVLGPSRRQTQVEISISDCFRLGTRAPLRDSGDLKGSSPVTLVGPAGSVTIPEGCIIAARHIHMSGEDALRCGVKDGDKVNVRAMGPRGLTFAEVLIRVSDRYRLEMHVDVDEGNAVGLKNGDKVKIVN
ncbi:MAG: phosphate propanoyltransferase [Bacillota bacterium]